MTTPTPVLTRREEKPPPSTAPPAAPDAPSPALSFLSHSQSMDEVSDLLFRHRALLLTWGDGADGQLGHSDFSNRIIPQAVHYFKSTTLVAVLCGSRSTLALDQDGRVFSWGKGEYGTLGTGERRTALRPRLVERLVRHPIAALAIRGSHVLALEENGQTWAWGKNDDGQLGLGEGHSLEGTSVPQRIPSLVGVRVTAIACGRTHSVLLDESGQLWSWGSGDDGVLGHGDTRARREPTKCAALAEQQMLSVACGSRHTLALASDGTLYSWGWGVYGQLGHGDVLSRRVPTAVQALREQKISVLACGYRHSMVLCRAPQAVWAWGWGQHGQLGLGKWVDELQPQRMKAFTDVSVKKLCLGGRHSLALCSDGRLYTWGRDEDGQLGLGAQGARCVPTPVEALATKPIALFDASCGWAHSACLVRAQMRGPSPSFDASPMPASEVDQMAASWRMMRREKAKAKVMPDLFVMSDFEGLFGLLLGTAIQFMLFETILCKSCGFTLTMIAEEVLPGATSSYFFGHLFFAIQATHLSRKTRNPVTALPQGINIVTFFAFTQLIMAPEYKRQLKSGVGTDQAARGAYNTGLAACFILGCLEMLALPFVNSLRKLIPRAAMLAAIAGVSLTFITMGFAVQVWAAPGTALVSMLLMLHFYAGNVKLPYKVPGGIVAVATGCFLSAASSWLGYDWAESVAIPFHHTSALHLPLPQLDFLSVLFEPAFYGYTSIILPMLLVNLINNLANIEAASVVGDRYDAQSCLLATAAIDVVSALLGNPFPACVYLGHAAYKTMGCRVGYVYLNLVPAAYFGLMQGASGLQRYVPIETGVGFLLWIGLQITASGFESDQDPEGWRHGPAVAIGLLPSLAAWSWQAVATTFVATRDLLCESKVGQSGEMMATSVPELCTMELADMIQKASTPIDTNSPLADFQWQLSSLFLSGLYALANGYLLSAIVLSSMLVHFIEGKFNNAAIWLTLAAAASLLGLMHSPFVDPRNTNPLFPIMYLISAAFVYVSHILRNQAEQIRELQEDATAVHLRQRVQPLLLHVKMPLLTRAYHATGDAVAIATAKLASWLPPSISSRLFTPVPHWLEEPEDEVSRSEGDLFHREELTQVRVYESSTSGHSSSLFDDLQRSRPLLHDFKH
ncbi:hypothetical protein AB1Y20_009819 [Prymnesium parvum]